MDSSFKAKWPEASLSVTNADDRLRFTFGLNQFSLLARVHEYLKSLQKDSHAWLVSLRLILHLHSTSRGSVSGLLSFDHLQTFRLQTLGKPWETASHPSLSNLDALDLKQKFWGTVQSFDCIRTHLSSLGTSLVTSQQRPEAPNPHIY